MKMQPTKYNNIQRTITGLNNLVYGNDMVLYCDSSLGPVSLNLLEFEDDKWNSIYKLYVIDKAGTASANNITINAPATYTINNASNLVLNTDGAKAIIRISANGAYSAQLNYGPSAGALAVLNEGTLLTAQASSIDFVGPDVNATVVGNAVTVNVQHSFISVTFAQLTTLINTGLIIPDQDYEIVDAEFGSTPVIPTKVYVQGITTNSVSIAGNGVFYNADYQGVGNYSGIPGFVANLGLWSQALVPVANNVVIWNNFHFRNILGVNGLSSPDLDPVNWELLPLTATNGYIVEVDIVEYSQYKNQILSRTDARLNTVHRFVTKVFNSLNFFKWGDQNVYGNTVQKESLLNNCNVVISQRFNHNLLENSVLQIAEPTGYFTILSFYNNILVNSSGDTLTNLGAFHNNIFNNNSYAIESTGTFRFNTCNGSSLTVIQNSSFIEYNQYDNSTALIEDNTATISNNTVSNGFFRVITINNGTISNNVITNGSTLEVTTNSLECSIQGNVISSSSSLVLTTNLNVADKNILKNGTTLSLTSNLADLSGNELSGSVITITNNANGFRNLTMERVTFNIMTPAYSISNGQAVDGNNSILYKIDCSDPSIYDAGTNTLTIPAEISAFAGIITLMNAGGLPIDKITNLSTRWLTTFSNDAGTTSFSTVAVGGAVASDIISSYAPLTTFAMVNRANGQDTIIFRAAGTFAAIQEANIYM